MTERSGRRVAGPDAAFLYAETRAWPMHVSGLIIVHGADVPGFGFDTVREGLIARIHTAPQLRWKLLEAPFGLGKPWFADDPDFDIDLHLHHVACPAPGGPKELGQLVGDLVANPIDRSIPLWELWVIDGLEDGKVGVLTKMHHSIIDGVSGADMTALMCDIEPDPPPDPPAPPYEPGSAPSLVERMVVTGADYTTWPLRIGRFVGQTAWQAVAALQATRSAKVAPTMPFTAPKVSFNGQISPHRRFAYSHASLGSAKHVKNAFGVKLNDVVLAVCAGALRRYLDERGELPEKALVAQVPVSLRGDGDTEIGTKVGSMFTTLATDIADPVERLRTINEGSLGAKAMQQAMASHKVINLTETTPPAMLSLAARAWTAAGIDGHTPPIFNVIISNVPGPPFDLYMAGARVEGIYPMGPLVYSGGLNITVISTAHELQFGFLCCRELVPDPWRIADAIPEELAILDELASTASGRG